ncbi:MAG: hypothetical protein Q9227_002618 [Pyrenula ochraceoflavens]
MSPQIERITMFKVPTEDGRAKMVEAYKKMEAENKRGDRQPYILSLAVGPAGTETPARNKGYTFAVKSTFASKDDMDFYDRECPAHKELKKTAGPLAEEPPLTVWFENALA